MKKELLNFIDKNNCDYTKNLINIETLKQIEKELNIEFGKQLTNYLLKFGYLGFEEIELYGINSSQGLDSDMIKQTKYLHQYFEKTIPFVAIGHFDETHYSCVDDKDIVYEYNCKTNEMTNLKYKKLVQTVIYFPHFLSLIILSSVLIDILSPSTGIVNKLLEFLGADPIFFLGDNRYFRGTMIIADVWKNFRYGTIVYLAAITSIDPNLYEAAAIDGAGRLRQTWHITLPGMRMIIVLMMVLSMGNVLNAGFDQIFNMYSPAVYETGDILDTMIYRLGLENAQFGPAAASGLFKSVISTIFISSSYFIADKFFDYKLF